MLRRVLTTADRLDSVRMMSGEPDTTGGPQHPSDPVGSVTVTATAREISGDRRPDPAPVLRVVQWATGNIGRRALREVIRDPALELVGVLTYNPDKHGVDAGDLCGEPATGVVATTDRAAIRALGADCVLYMPM